MAVPSSVLTLILDCSERSKDLVHVTVTVEPSSTQPSGTAHDITVPLYEEHYQKMWQRGGVEYSQPCSPDIG